MGTIRTREFYNTVNERIVFGKKLFNKHLTVLIFLAIIVFLFSSCETSKSIDHEKPNIVLILADDLGYEGLSCNGSTSYNTPTLDKLADDGVRFTNCYSTPLCTTSRIQLMTGMYNNRNYTEFGTMPPDQITFAHLLKGTGYSTCVAGKWQLVGHYEGAGYKGKGTYPEENGFEEYCLWQLDKFGSRYWEPLLNTNGVYKQYDKSIYGPDVICDFIIDYIDRKKDNPFLIYYPMILTHDPFVPTPNSDFSEEEKHKNNPKYFKDMVEYTDFIVSRIINKLEQENLLKNTLVIFIGDNGTHNSITSKMGDYSIKGEKGKTTSAGTHVPMIARFQSKHNDARICEDLIDFTDFLPTLLELAGIDNYAIPHKDGRSFLPQILGKFGNPREWIYCDYNPKWGKWMQKKYVQTKKWKLYADGSFINLLQDFEENNPLSMDELSKNDLIEFNKLLHVLNNMN